MIRRLLAVMIVFAIITLGACGDLIDSDPEESVSGSITSDTTWSSDTKYLVTGDVDVTGHLTIEPGTTVLFEQGTTLEISDSGALIAEGTADDQIIFTGTEEVAGWWKGIWFRNTQNPLNSIDYATIEYGGNEFPAVLVGEYRATGSSVDAAAAITNTTVRNNDASGVYVERGSELTDFGNNVMTENDPYPVTLRDNPSAAAAIDTDSDLTGNENDAVRILDDGANITSDIAFVDPGVPYRVQDARIEVRGHLTVAEGVTMEFDSDSSLRMNRGGGLHVTGTKDDPVLFTATSPTPGFWEGINFMDSDRPDNKIEYAVIEYGGSEPSHTGWNRSGHGGNITIGRSIDSADLTVENSHINHSSSYGIYVYDGNLSLSSVEVSGYEDGDVFDE